MKNLFFISLLSLVLFSCNSIANSKSETFKVYGNCGMCKKTIEESLNKEGIKSDWDKKSKMMQVTYDSIKFNNQQIHQLIADAGYDTELKTGNDSAYNNLHECCKYDRKAK